MHHDERKQLEARLRGRAEQGDLEGLATEAVEAYGPELLGYLVATCKDRSVADEVFSMTCEDLWKGIEAFRWESSLRTWLYVLARHAHARYRRSPHERRRATLGALHDVEERVRTNTRPWLKTTIKDRLAELRRELSDAERELLVLRIDRRMSWADIARVLGEDDERAVPRVRKRFSLLKNRLHARAREAGRLDPGSET